MDVIFKEGLLYQQGVKFGKKTWRKIWMVLYKPSSTGVGRLELFTVLDKNNVTDQKRAGWQKTPDRKAVRLCDCLSVTPAPDKSCPPGCTAFYLKTTQCNYTLASTTSQDWLSAVSLLAFQKDPEESDKRGLQGGNGPTMKNNDLYSSWKTNPILPPTQYRVTVQSTEASRRCGLAGDYLLSLEEEALTLLTGHSGLILYRWPYTLIRKFGKVEGGFSFDAGHRCQSGNGVFIFLSPHGPEILQVILEHCSVERSSSAQAFNISRRWSCDQSPSTCTFPSKAAGPPVYSSADVPVDAEDDSTVHYSTINYNGLNLVKPHLSKSQEAVGDVDEDEQYHSLGSLSLEGGMEDNIYYNWRRSTPPLIRGDRETDESECIYSDVKNDDSPSNSRLQPFSSPLCQPVLQPPPCPPSPPVLSALNLKPRDQRWPAASNVNQGSVSLHGGMEDNIYYNWRRSTPPLIRRDPEADESECIYSDVKKADSPSNSRLQPFSSPLCQPPPCPPSPPVPSALNLKPRYQHQPTGSNVNQAGFNTQAHEADGMNEMEEAIGSSAHGITPSETPGSFKFKLAELFSKDLAKIQPPLPSGAGGPTFSH